jgi:dTDP-4-dehydrorhamnose reductase
MKILVTGSKGQLGTELILQGGDFGFEIIGADLPELDITDINQTRAAVSDSQAFLVINAAAYTAVDKAETEQELAFSVNRDGPANLAESCADVNIPLIHISTDFVFDGKKTSPYLETDAVSPVSVYGRSKAAGEDAVRERISEHIILRTSWLYSVQGYNFVKTMLRLGQEKDVIRVVADQYGCPTSAADLAEALLRMAAQLRERSEIQWGTYHYCGQGITTWHGFAEAIFELSGKTAVAEPIPTAEYPTPAQRPAFSALDCTRIQEHFGIVPRPWKKSLKEVVEHAVV